MSVALVLLGLGLLLLPGPARRPRRHVTRGSGGRRSAPRPRSGPRPRSAVRHVDRDLPVVLDLAAVALRAGAAPGPALVAASAAAREPLHGTLARVGGLLTLGADPAEAWAAARSTGVGSAALATVAVLAERSGTSGARLADAFTAAAATLRDDTLADGRRAAARVGVWSVVPLGLCFLPAFVGVGIVPAVVGLLAGTGAALP